MARARWQLCRVPTIVPKVIFPTVDLGAAETFYAQLGFGIRRDDEGDTWVLHDGHELLHLARVDDLDLSRNRAAAYLHVQDADACRHAWLQAGVDVGPIADEPFGMREFQVTDPSGNLLRVGHRLRDGS